MSNGPVEPNADMRVWAHSLHQMFVAMQQEGFTQQQALTILGHTIGAAFANAKPEEEDDKP